MQLIPSDSQVEEENSGSTDVMEDIIPSSHFTSAWQIQIPDPTLVDEDNLEL